MGASSLHIYFSMTPWTLLSQWEHPLHTVRPMALPHPATSTAHHQILLHKTSSPLSGLHRLLQSCPPPLAPSRPLHQSYFLVLVRLVFSVSHKHVRPIPSFAPQLPAQNNHPPLLFLLRVCRAKLFSEVPLDFHSLGLLFP